MCVYFYLWEQKCGKTWTPSSLVNIVAKKTGSAKWVKLTLTNVSYPQTHLPGKTVPKLSYRIRLQNENVVWLTLLWQISRTPRFLIWPNCSKNIPQARHTFWSAQQLSSSRVNQLSTKCSWVTTSLGLQCVPPASVYFVTESLGIDWNPNRRPPAFQKTQSSITTRPLRHDCCGGCWIPW